MGGQCHQVQAGKARPASRTDTSVAIARPPSGALPSNGWHRPSFATCIDVGKSYDLEITELDYRLNPGIAYQANGVTIKHFPRLHTIDGAIGYRLEWNGLSMVWTGDGQPSYVTSDNAKGVDLFISETAPSTERFAAATGLPLATAKIIVANSHRRSMRRTTSRPPSSAR